MGATAELARFAADFRCEDLPPEVLRESKRCILNYLGVSLGAARHPAVGILADAILEMGGQEQATILGWRTRTSATNAALVNGAMSHLLDFDDTHLPTVIHPTGPVLSAALPLAEWKRLDGRHLMTALALGMEIELRIGMAVHPSHYDAGWHITGTVGTFGAAVASAWLLGLDATRFAYALGLAGTQAAGLREMFGSMAKSLHVGKAASNGMLAALLAAKGFTASTEVLEGRRGFCHVLAGDYDLSRALDGLGSRYIMLENGFKPYACGVVTHPTIDGIRQLARAHHLIPTEVAEIETRVHPLVLELTGKRSPRTGLEGKFSIYFCAAIAMIEGNAREAQFTDENVVRPDVTAMMDRVRVVVDPSLREGQSMVTIRTVDGRELNQRVEAAQGTPGNPVPDDELQEKFMELAQSTIPRDRAARLVEATLHLESLVDLRHLVELAAA